MSQTQASPPNLPFSTESLWAALAGACGGLLAFPIGEIVGYFVDSQHGMARDLNGLFQLIFSTAIWSGCIGLAIGITILAFDNMRSLRGQWHRDIPLAIPLFFGLSFIGGAAGQISYSFIQNSLTRGIGWALMGAGVGVGIGVLRRDLIQAQRGALGGAIGGFVGGFIFDALILLSDANGGSLSRFVGQIIMGALVALLMRVVQDALKNAWLLGISTGPYEGKEYPLNVNRVSIGRSGVNDIALFREEMLPDTLGTLVFSGDQWWWQGNAIDINGALQTSTPLAPGDTLSIGTTRFRFQMRSVKEPVARYDVPPYNGSPVAAPYPPQASPYVAAPAPPATVGDWAAPAPYTAPAATVPMTSYGPTFVLVNVMGQPLSLPASVSGGTGLSIGRGNHNQLVLPDAGVSSTHARMQQNGQSLTLTDLGSTNGTWVNGTRLPPQVPHTLRAGDKVRFGALEYTVRAQ